MNKKAENKFGLDLSFADCQKWGLQIWELLRYGSEFHAALKRKKIEEKIRNFSSSKGFRHLLFVVRNSRL